MSIKTFSDKNKGHVDHGKKVKKNWKVLVIDDDPTIVNTLESYLKFKKEYEVLKAFNAYEGLAIIEQVPSVDLVFVDINMPGMNGIELVKKLKTKDRTIVCAIITGQPSMDIIIEAMRSGASDFLSKPFKFDQFQVAVQRMIKERSILLENEFLTEEVKIKRTLEQMNLKLEKKIREQTILFSISETLSKTRNTADMYQTLVELGAKLLDARQAVLWIKSEDSKFLELVASIGPFDAKYEKIDISSSSHPAVKVVKEGIPIISSGKGQRQRVTDSYLLVPFRIREELIGVLGITGPYPQGTSGEEALFLLHILSERASLTVENLLLYDSLFMNLHATLRALVRSLEAKDPYTKLHSERVTEYALTIARQMKCNDEEMESLTFAGHLHDIGKIGIRDQILMKPGKLTDEEYEIIKTHPVIGAEIVGHLGLLKTETAIIRHHHERWDGRGYPDGLRKRDIPKLSRILAVADTFDAITSRRPYRDAKTVEFAVNEIDRNSGSQFDPDVVMAFLQSYKTFPQIN